MKVTPDRMLIGKVVRDTYGGKDDDYSDSYLQHLIESIPFPKDDEHHDCHWRRLDDARREEIAADAAELVALVGHCDDPKCEGKWCVTARAFIEKIRACAAALEAMK